MFQTERIEINTRMDQRIGIQELCQALLWLGAGGLLGTLVALPYDQLLGVPGAVRTLAGAVVWCALLGASQMPGAWTFSSRP